MEFTLIEKSLVIAFLVLGAASLLWDGMLLEKLRPKLEKALPEFLQKPLFACAVCMTPWWGSLAYIILFGFDGLTMLSTIIIAFTINLLLVKFLNMADAISAIVGDLNGEEEEEKPITYGEEVNAL